MLPIGMKISMDINQEILLKMSWLYYMKKIKEFVQEGQRWWDVLRMTLTKGGKHLVFCKEANLKNDGVPILNEATESHKVLWPIEQNMLDKDPSIKQTPGYDK